jgi:predicted  nucleic acid-binding Zn-ribbon protein
MLSPMSDAYNNAGMPMDGLPSYQDLENAVLNGATAIHCLTAERNQLRSRIEAQETEIESLRTTNEHLRRQLLLIGDSYVKYAASCASQLQHIAQAMQNVEQREASAEPKLAAL